jgi:NAD(P)-dependent dehydrogenase (short-subunit alcohol dehydrogenase family)
MSDRTMQGRVALVTGTGPGIGRACALALAADGADVALAARRVGPLDELAEEIAAATGRRTLAVPTDIADVDQCVAAIETTVSELGRIDALVNIATYGGGRALLDELDWDDYLTAVQINVVGTLELCRTAARHMGARGEGSIVNISTLSTSTKMVGMARYTSTKGAMEIASKTLAKEAGPDGVRVNIVTPGMTTGDPLTALFERMAEAQGRTAAEVSERFARDAALRRHVDPADIAEAVLFLASPRSRNVTGQEIQVTAGQHIV